MKKGVIITLLIVVILIVIGAVLGGSYNGLVTKSWGSRIKIRRFRCTTST